MQSDQRGSGEGSDHAARTLSAAIASPTATVISPNKVKVIVAVHGIGDQSSAETVSSVAARFCRYVKKPAAIPLGRFHGAEGVVSAAYFPNDILSGFPEDYGFAEIYWADVPRQVVREGYTLEESKRWARTIVGRLQLRKTGLKEMTANEIQDNRLMVQVVREMIEGVAVMDRLLFVARKAGLFDFNLNKLLNDFLNDVQIVAEFTHQRDEILGLFRESLRRIIRSFPNAEIHVVAHSEGTVVSFLGLLAGLKNAARSTDGLDGPERDGVEADLAWTRRLRGYMTIGSPLNKHLVFWPQLFDAYGDAPGGEPGERIRWRNYYDFGDPIGFDLRHTRDWMKAHGWDRCFEFNGPEDVAGAARGRAEVLLRRTETPPRGPDGPPEDKRAARLIEQARSLAEKAKALALEIEVPAEDGRKGPRVTPGRAQALAHRAEILVGEAESKAGRAHREGERGLAPAAEPCAAKKLHDHGFTRYYFPAAAHNDYWTDDEVFGHFIQEVVDPDDKLQRRQDRDYRQPPPTRLVPRLTSYVLPYVLSNTLLVVGVYVLYKAVRACVTPGSAPFDTVGMTAWNVLGLSLLVNGMTVLSRLPVLSRPLFWRAVAVAVFAASAVAFHWCVDRDIRVTIGSFLLQLHGLGLAVVLVGPLVVIALLAFLVRRDSPGTDLRPMLAAGVSAWVILIALTAISRFWSVAGAEGPRVDPATATFVLVTLAATFGVIAWVLSRQYPDLGMRPMIHTGGLIVFLIVVISLATRPSSADLAEWLRDKELEPARREAVLEFREAQRAVKSSARRPGDAASLGQARGRIERAAARVADLDRQARALLDDGPVWPVVLAFPAFLYLWWLSALLFDLTFFWHRYIRHAAGVTTLNEMASAHAVP